jgi:peptidoglycan/LPS O-acetylase OafA/YrhL
MSAEPVWPFFALVALALALATLAPFRSLDAFDTGTARHAGVDGLRGFLALAVFVFHLVVTRRFVDTGVWQVPDSRFYALLGPIGVSMFFMITGFLFWGKLLRAKGRPGWAELYIGRLLRIAPMYLFVVVTMLAIVFWRTGLQLREPVADVAWQIAQWLALGWLDAQPDVNGYPAVHLLAGVTWTIYYEWLFYASLLLLAPFARGPRHLATVGVALVLMVAGKLWLHSHAMGLAALFLYGMLSASLLHDGLRPRLSDRAASVLAGIGLGLVVVAGVSRGGYGSLVGLLLGLVFYLVCCGATLFGLLTSAAARRLGGVSYSIYLMQGLVLALVFAIGPVREAALATPAGFWMAGALSLLLLVLASALTYRRIELPGMALGRWLQQRLRERSAHQAAVAVQGSTNQVGEKAVKAGL